MNFAIIYLYFKNPIANDSHCKQRTCYEQFGENKQKY